MMVGGTGGYGGHPSADLSFSRERHPSTASLLDAIERRTQKTYRYGIGLVCIGATLNWLGFAQGNSYIDPLRYLGVACVISGSFCVCLAMCRWLGRPISVSGHHLPSLEEDSLSRMSGDVHVINVAVPLYMSSQNDEYRRIKPPDYDIVAGEPPCYDEAIKLQPGSLIEPPSPSHPLNITIRKSPPPPYRPSSSPSPSHPSIHNNLHVMEEGNPLLPIKSLKSSQDSDTNTFVPKLNCNQSDDNLKIDPHPSPSSAIAASFIEDPLNDDDVVVVNLQMPPESGAILLLRNHDDDSQLKNQNPMDESQRFI